MYNEIRKDLLIPLKEVGINAFIFGGYVRDTFNDRDYRDIDLVVHKKVLSSALQFFGLELRVKRSSTYLDSVGLVSNYEFSHLVYPEKLYNINLLATKYNFSNMSEVEKVTRLLVDKGICMCAIDAEKEFYGEEFIRDIEDSQITLLRNPKNLNVSLNHWAKLQDKYPWPLRLSETVLEGYKKNKELMG